MRIRADRKSIRFAIPSKGGGEKTLTVTRNKRCYPTETGVVIGNVDSKYETKNVIAKALMDGFMSSFDDLVRRTGETFVHEIGCGEGHLSARLTGLGLRTRDSDFSQEIISVASTLNGGYGIEFKAKSIYDLSPGEDSAPLVVCCEVMEHLDDPDRGLERLQAIAEKFCIVSVPREPLWRVLNMARGKYLRQLGNTPGHLQHWSQRRFVSFVRRRFDILEIRSPLPWTMILCHRKSH